MTNDNRVLAAWHYWHDKEKSLKQAAGPDIVGKRHFLKEKFQYYNHIKNLFKGNDLSLDERITRRIIAGEAKDIEKQIYPKRIERLLRRGYRQMYELTLQMKVREKIGAFLNKVLTHKQGSSYTAKNHKQTHNQTDKQEQNSAKQSQKPVMDVERNIQPERHTIIGRTLRSDDRMNGDRVNHLSSRTKPERRHRHRLQ